jgi:hypothetical protein
LSIEFVLPRSRVNAGGDIVRTKFDTSGQDALANTLKNKQVKFETDELERQMLLSKPQLASKIRKYQNETDINTPNSIINLSLNVFSIYFIYGILF